MEILNRPASNKGTSSWLCGLIACLRNAPPLDTCTAYVVPEIGLLARVLFTPATENYPAWFAARWDDRGLLAIDGATSIGQLNGVVDGYTGTIQQGFNDPYNSRLQGGANLIWATLNGLGYTNAARWTVAGYSMGGAIAELMPWRSDAKPQNAPTVETVTFGAPRAGGASVCRVISSTMNLTRWMTANDAVPLIPVHTSSMPTLPLIIGIRPAMRWQNFLHPAGGEQINMDGSRGGTVLPSVASVNMALSLANWWWSFYTGNANDHMLYTYQARLRTGDILDGPTVIQARGHTETPIEVTRHTATRGERTAQQQLIAIERRNNQVAEIIPKVVRFTHVKIGRAHYVTLRGKVISTGTDKRNAIGICREMNSGLRRLQRQAIVDTDALAKEFAEYLGEASDPTGEFSPVMNTQWNQGLT